MDPIKQIEVEPLSDQRWSKIEKSIFAQLENERLDREPEPKMVSLPPRSAWRWRPAVALVMAGAMAAAIGALATKSMFTSPVAPVASAPSRVVTGSSDSHIALGESDVDVAPESAVLVSGDDDRGIMVVVDRGKVECEVAPRKGRPPFLVQAGDVRVKVVGTHFTVARDAQGGGAHVLVAHGIVEVTSHGQTTTLHDGDSWPAAPTTLNTPSPITTATPSPVTQNDPPAPAPRMARTSRSKSAPLPKTSTPRKTPAAPIAAAADPPQTAPLPAPVGAPLPAPVGAPPALSSPPASSPPAAATQAPASVNLPPPPTQAPATTPPPPPTPQPSAQEMYEAAAQLEAQNPDGALATYKKIAGGGGAWAANALFAAGRLQAHRGRNGDAARLLDEYLVRFPNGANAADARELLAKVK
jgi:FecR protein